ncbi:MAG: hypothetical protein KVP17_001052 [Porospora cf. gigantea B]|uniref:uncharacterized protein n=1 Tax=Porospora cf. gigantea B TaxID=2853592 RepID=UPI003571EFDF|nr:MAG: hypothetical protein KVP17_001052 [Porospora cf. gigantea B]
MSSLAAARADNFYYGPDYDPDKHKSLNNYRDSNGALGKRAKDLHKGVLVIRFEMPFKVWCLGCDQIIAKGVRFNARKRCVGNYFTTKIYEFSMYCYWCPQEIVIQTDPKTCEYVCKSGIRRKVEEYTPDEGDVPRMEDTEERERMERDPIYRMEITREKVRKTIEKKDALSEVKSIRDGMVDDYSLNSSLRRADRVKRRAENRVKHHSKVREAQRRMPDPEGLHFIFRKMHGK